MKLKLSCKARAVINLILGLFLWFLFSSDYSLTGTIPDILFPPLVGIIALISVFSIKTSDKHQRLWIRLAHLPAIIGGTLYLLMGFVMFIPPFTLGALFMMSEISDEVQIQQAVSPDGTQSAYVYFRGVGAYSGGNGRTYVRTRYSLLPFIERDLFTLSRSDASEQSTDYVKWHGNDTLYISEIGKEIPAGEIRAEIPVVIAIPYYMVRIIFSMAERNAVDQQKTILVENIPIYPGNVFDNQLEFLKAGKTEFRSFRLDEKDIEHAKEWYAEAVTKGPWELVKINRHTETRGRFIYIRYCIQAKRDISNMRPIYYWELTGRSDMSRGVQVTIGTPNPITDICKRFAQ